MLKQRTEQLNSKKEIFPLLKKFFDAFFLALSEKLEKFLYDKKRIKKLTWVVIKKRNFNKLATGHNCLTSKRIILSFLKK
jgi:hypothetical protein